MKLINRKSIWVAVIAFAAGIAFSLLPILYLRNDKAKNLPLRENSTKYKYVNPLLVTGDIDISKSFNDLQIQLFDQINEDVKKGLIASASVYFRDLNSGSWTGVNENEKYAPASMYKVVLMIALLKEAYENNPRLLDQKMTIKNTSTKREEIFTVGQIIRIMITQSDNNAKNVLESLVKPSLEKKVFSDFGLLPPDFNNGGNSLSSKEYSIFFRILYNSNYLGSDLSEAALMTLAEKEFSDGLIAGVASSTQVAHKFGYKIFTNGVQSSQELHDCGIVYHPKHPYFICVMTRGSNVESLKAVIRDISGITYKYVDEKIKDN